MHHVVISCFKTDISAANLEHLQKCVTELLQRDLGCREDAVSIDLQQVEPANWREQIYQPMIAPRLSSLLRQPGYQY
ncbi:tautomerase family protein [Verminephrobacter aporrectodeae]|uniref:hypothetical protein n=1 Tax=Verminephrobacter aporrectodeae TaxID=1110389 RepID=UPI00223755F5|nr:hypothetical protein [Verminephrobacter aporrectodeae]